MVKLYRRYTVAKIYAVIGLITFINKEWHDIVIDIKHNWRNFSRYPSLWMKNSRWKLSFHFDFDNQENGTENIQYTSIAGNWKKKK